MKLLTLLAFALLPASAPAQQAPIRVWGDVWLGTTLDRWEHAYQALHPDARFDNHLLGTDTAMPALYNNLADLGLFGREPNQTENDGFLHSLQYTPIALHLTAGSLDRANQSPAPVVLVPGANPLRQLTLLQLEQLLGCGQPGIAPARVWGDLGLTGAWASRPIHIYTFDLKTGTGTFLLQRVQGPSKKMNWPVITEFRDIERPTGTTHTAAEQTAEALRRDPNGIALSTLSEAHTGLRALPLATATGAAIAASPQTVTDRSYPLARLTYVYLNRPPGKPLPAGIAAFVDYILSPAGQFLITGYLPLAPADAQAQRTALTHALR